MALARCGNHARKDRNSFVIHTVVDRTSRFVFWWRIANTAGVRNHYKMTTIFVAHRRKLTRLKTPRPACIMVRARRAWNAKCALRWMVMRNAANHRMATQVAAK
jgi:hypothetical protein